MVTVDKRSRDNKLQVMTQNSEVLSKTRQGLPRERFAHIFFLDGVGLGSADAKINPFVQAHMPNLAQALGCDDWYLCEKGIVTSDRATIVPTDATLSMPGKPQSATGQATILSGRNVPLLVGEHYGPKPNGAVTNVIREGTLFSEVYNAGRSAALLTPYPQGYFDAINSGKRLYSAVPQAVTDAGWPLFTYDDLKAGRAVSPGFTNEGWRDLLGYSEIEIFSLHEAGRRIAAIARGYDFSFFEHWPSDRSGHRGSLAEAIGHLERIDEVVGGLLAEWWDEHGVLIITSDHGNIEEKDHRQHTRNPVPTIIVGADHHMLAQQIENLADIAGVVRSVLNLEARE